MSTGKSLSAAADSVTADLQRTLGGRWVCVLDDEMFLSVCDGFRLATRELTAHEEKGATAVAGLARHLLASLGIIWPVCPEHLSPATPAAADWECTAAPHRIAAIGQLLQCVTSPAL